MAKEWKSLQLNDVGSRHDKDKEGQPSINKRVAIVDIVGVEEWEC